MLSWYLISGINPEPWSASEASIGRKNGKVYPHFHKPEQLRQYQESVKDMFMEQNPQAVKVTGDIELVFYFWRQLTAFELTEGKKNRRSAYADATNLQKALEDALQKILYENDRDIKSVRSVIVEQTQETEPAILIGIGSYDDSEEQDTVQRTRSLLTQPELPRESNIRDFDVGEVF